MRTYFKSKEDFATQLAYAVRRVAPEFGLKPQPTDLFIVAHSSISTGWGGTTSGRGVGYYNFFGMKANSSWHGAVHTTGGSECEAPGTPGGYVDVPTCGENKVRVDHKTITWKAFASIEDCVREYLRMVSSLPIYRKAFQALKDANMEYMRILAGSGWATADEDRLQAMWSSNLKRIAAMPFYQTSYKPLVFIVGAAGLLWLAKRKCWLLPVMALLPP